MNNRPFTIQLIILGGFILFFYIFFALAAQIYKDYRLQKHIEEFESKIEELADLANRKPQDIEYFSSKEYKDRYAKESLNLLNPGEKLIVIPQEEQKIVKGRSNLLAGKTSQSILDLPNRNQWWEYFFGETLSLKAPKEPIELPALEPIQETTGG